jgi:formate dehydrogenase subunit gamma
VKERILTLNLATPVSPAPSIRIATTPIWPERPAPVSAPSRLILRFQRSERLLHWSIAVPFMVCYFTAAILILFFGLHSERPTREVLSWIHRIAGVCLLAFPLWTAVRNWSDCKLHLSNISQAWHWALADLKWLVLMGVAMIRHRIQLPEQGKFNAAEKLNFMMVMGTYPVFIVTGVLLWLPGIAFVSWVLHVGMALVATPLMLGHIYMALINPGTRVGLGGMISGYVDRQWAKHHYQRWYRENFEEGARRDHMREALRRPVLVRCQACHTEHLVASWVRVLESVLEVQPLRCPQCGASAQTVSVILDPAEAVPMLRALEQTGTKSLMVAHAEEASTPTALPPTETLQAERAATRRDGFLD